MSTRVAGLVSLASLCVVANFVAPSDGPRVYADGVNCAIYISDYLMTPPPEQYLGGYGTTEYYPDAANGDECISLFLDASARACATACQNAGVSSGQYGVALCYTYGNEARWNGTPQGYYQNDADYPYDCGQF